MHQLDPESYRRSLKELLEDRPMPYASNIRRHLGIDDIEDVNVSMHGTVEAVIEDSTGDETVTAAAILPTAYGVVTEVFALGQAGDALSAAIGDGKPRKIVGKMVVGDGGGDLLAVHAIIASAVPAPDH